MNGAEPGERDLHSPRRPRRRALEDGGHRRLQRGRQAGHPLAPRHVGGERGLVHERDRPGSAGTFTGPRALTDVNWKMAGVGDFNGDGKPDILWRHQVSGQIVLWFMDGANLRSGTFTTPATLPDTNWRSPGRGLQPGRQAGHPLAAPGVGPDRDLVHGRRGPDIGDLHQPIDTAGRQLEDRGAPEPVRPPAPRSHACSTPRRAAGSDGRVPDGQLDAIPAGGRRLESVGPQGPGGRRGLANRSTGAKPGPGSRRTFKASHRGGTAPGNADDAVDRPAPGIDFLDPHRQRGGIDRGGLEVPGASRTLRCAPVRAPRELQHLAGRGRVVVHAARSRSPT